ncbi:MAG TPA: hypothetical protein PK264_24370 [Hyphomicrobiaceae bacterium]|nr:hypothetical protein [Hyphomicrobiaceae bacterium]
MHVLLALISIIEVGLGLVVRLWQVGAAVRYGQLPILNLAIAVASLAAGGVGLNWLRRLWRRALVARSLE